MYRSTILIVILTLTSFVSGKSQSSQHTIHWLPAAPVSFNDTEIKKVLTFTDAQYLAADNFLPRYTYQFAIAENVRRFSTTINNAVFKNVSDQEQQLLANVSNIHESIITTNTIVKIKKKPYAQLSLIPIRLNKTTGKYEKLVSFETTFTYFNTNRITSRATHTYASNSVLSTGKWFKIGITASGVYKLSYNQLQQLGMDIDNINPQNIRIYGNGGGMLAELTTTPRTDDLAENSIHVEGENDGSFNEDDYILFYGQSQHNWEYNPLNCPQFSHSVNIYTDTTYYFITASLGTGQRIAPQNSSSTTITHNVNTFDDYAYHELEKVNFLKSGKLWFGEYYENNTTSNHTFTFPNIETGQTVTIKAAIAARSFNSIADFTVSCESGSTNIDIAKTNEAKYTDDYAKFGNSCFSLNPTSSLLNVVVTKNTSDAIAWLDYIEVNARRKLVMNGNQMLFRDAQSVGAGNVAGYILTGNESITIWDITDIHNPKEQIVTKTGSTSSFALSSSSLREFIAFNNNYKIPTLLGEVANQNLHALSNKDYIIVSHPDFFLEANILANHHLQHDGLSNIVVTPQQIYNEFSSGAKDVTAIRDFVKMFYDKANNASEMPKYLLLFGDGSYDNKNILSSKNDFIPTYQSTNSTFETSSYVSDDFYGLLDDGEGIWTADAVDIGVGRIPVKSKEEAQIAVAKIINYATNNFSGTSSFGNWRNVVCFIADDGDINTHISQANQQATMIDTTYKNYNIDKIYLDAYEQTTVPGGNRYPSVNDAIDKRVEQGALIINYTGHGSETNLAHEAILTSSTIPDLANPSKLFLFITASCQVSKYDNPDRNSAGEFALLQANGGAIALLSTVRAVFASPNFELNKNFYKSVFEPINGRMPRLGDLYQYVKTQAGGNSVNSRSFALLGDPALTLAYPKHEVITDSINHIAVTTPLTDTLKALTLVTISGHIQDSTGALLSNFNGSVFPTVYDKPKNITTLSNKGSSESPSYTFNLQKNVLFNGEASVNNGAFSFSFMVPKDISYQFGIGKISYYAADIEEDANGSYENFVVGGFNANASSDNTAPAVDLYMNDERFVFGGLTNEDPDLFAILFDENGINTVGNSVGHDITGILDGDTQNPIILNNFYKANKDSYQKGTVVYPFNNLSEGKHNLRVKAWDVHNNASEAYTEFVVAGEAEVALKHVLNYPNPFTTNTQFYFEHNQANSTFEVQVQVFTVAGKLVKTISQFVNTNGFRSDPINWDGKDDFGDKIGRGVYIYRIKVISADNGTDEKYEKLVILN